MDFKSIKGSVISERSVQIIPEHRVCKSDVQPRITTVLLSMPVVTVSSCGMSFRRDVRVSSQREPRVTFLRSSMVAAATAAAAAAAGYRQFLSELRPTLKSGLFREILSRWKNMDRLTTTAEASPPVASIFNATKQMAWSFYFPFFFFFFFNNRGDVNNICVIFAMADRGPQFVCARVRKVTMR